MFFKKKVEAEVMTKGKMSEHSIESQLRSELDVKNEHLKHAMSEINRLNQYIMKMDFVKEMITNLNLQLENIEMVAASSQEISASIIEIAEHVVDNAKAAEKSVGITEQGTNSLKNAVKAITAAFDMTETAKTRVEDVTSQAKKINEMIAIIESVAGQTNLLALNASIEAARAGEAGRGFAVVADEIKKLAESTKDSVKLIQDTVTSLNNSVKSSVEAIEEATISFNVGMEAIHTASHSVESSEGEIRTILTSMETVRDQIETQTAASEEVASSISQINESAKQLHKETTQTGKAFSDIASEVNGIRLDLFERQSDLSPSYMIELTITDHMNWRWNIYNMLMGFNKIQTSTLGTHKECRLGQWIESYAKTVPEFQPALQKLNGPHESLHRAAAEAVKSYNNGNQRGAEAQLEQIDLYSKIIVNELSNMLAISLEQEKGKRDIAYFKWTSDLTVYNTEIDEQHKQLLSIGSKLEAFSKAPIKTKEAFLAIAKELKDYTVYHFDHEESMLIKARYPDIERHKKIHRGFVEEISAVDYQNFDVNDSKALEKLVLFLSQWVVKHIKNEDFKYSSHLNKQ